MRHKYPFEVQWNSFSYRLFDICSSTNNPGFFHEIYLSVPAIEIKVFPDWLEEPYESNYPNDSDWDEIPF